MSWVDRLRDLELELNHLYANPYPDYPSSHWGPRSSRLCAFLDWLTRGWWHD